MFESILLEKPESWGKAIVRLLVLAVVVPVVGCDCLSLRRDPFAESREVLWTTLKERFFCEKTEMLYDVLWRADDGTVSAAAVLATAAELTVDFAKSADKSSAAFPVKIEK